MKNVVLLVRNVVPGDIEQIRSFNCSKYLGLRS